MPIQAYVDDSGAPPNERCLVLAGYLASTDQWASFSDEWDRALRMRPRLEYFKMADAVKLRKSFDGWTPHLRDERLRMLKRIIQDHVQCFVASVVPFADFNRALTEVPMKLKFRPYAAALMGLMGATRAHIPLMDIHERVDFIFDEQVMEKGIILENWDYATANVEPGEQEFVSKTPAFRNDRDFLPLQAADLCAWLQRNSWEAQNGHAQVYEPPWTNEKPIEGLTFQLNEDDIRNVLRIAYGNARAELDGSI